MATAASKTKPTFEFNFELEEGYAIPEDAGQPARPNVIKDQFFTPSLAKIIAAPEDKPVEPTMFFPLSYFQQISNEWAAKTGNTAKELTIGDARQKLNDAFKKFEEKNSKASLVTLVLVARTGKEGDAKAKEPGVRAWMKLKGK